MSKPWWEYQCPDENDKDRIAKPAVCKARVHLFWAASLLPQTRALKQDHHQTRCNTSHQCNRFRFLVESLSNPTLALCLIHKTEKYIRAMCYRVIIYNCHFLNILKLVLNSWNDQNLEIKIILRYRHFDISCWKCLYSSFRVLSLRPGWHLLASQSTWGKSDGLGRSDCWESVANSLFWRLI